LKGCTFLLTALAQDINPLKLLSVEPIENNISHVELASRLSRTGGDWDKGNGGNGSLGSNQHFCCPLLSLSRTNRR
jgi:hypothetical protein